MLESQAEASDSVEMSTQAVVAHLNLQRELNFKAARTTLGALPQAARE